MAISGIASPVAGTVITTAFVDLNYRDPLLYAIGLLGGFGGEPDAANKMLVSSGAEAAAWVYRTAAVLAALTYTPVNKAGDTMSGALQHANNIALRGTDTGGTPRNIAVLANDNAIYLGNASGATLNLVASTILQAVIGGNTYGIWHDGNTTNAVVTSKILDLNVTTGKLADLAVTEAKLATDAVTNAKIGPSAVNTAELADGAVLFAKIGDAQVATSKILDLNVTTGKIADLAVTAAKIASNTITNSQLAGGAAVANIGYTPARIASGTYAGNDVASGRQITTGFACKLVLIQELSQNASWYSNNTTECMVVANGPVVGGSGDIHLHASDGFVVGEGSSQGNVSGRTYNYTAFG